jgi:hypothetical protein
MFRLSLAIALRATLLIAVIAGTACAEEHWNLPVEVSDRNTRLSVSIETSTDRLSGTVRSLSGRMWLADPKDPTSIRAQLEIPTSDFETGDTNRDIQLRGLLGALGVGGASLELRAVGGGCYPGYVKLGRPCEGRLAGEIAFQGVRRPIDLPFKIKREGPRYRVDGRLALPAHAFALSDQLKLLLGFLKEVTVAYTCVL